MKEIYDMVGAIGETFSGNDLVATTLNGILDDYLIFITILATMDKTTLFIEMIVVLLREDKRRNNHSGGSQSTYLVLVA